MANLSGKQRRFLRALGHKLKPIVLVGKDGVTEGLCHAVDEALLQHELIKVRLGQNAEVERRAAAVEMAKATGSAVAQVLGSTILLYRAHPEEPKIELPKRGANDTDVDPRDDDDDDVPPASE